MNQPIPASQLVLNAEGAIYHLNLHPDQLADDVIMVGDPGRVELIASFFDKIEVKRQNRELVTRILEEREDLKYVADVMPDNYAALQEKFGPRVFATPKKMGAQTAEANVNAGLAAARHGASGRGTPWR